MTQASGILGLVLFLAAMPASKSFAQDEGRWCTDVIGAHSQQLIPTKSEVSMDCDGGLHGSVLNDTPITEITIRMRQDGPGGRDRYATFKPSNLTVEDTDVQYEGGGRSLKAQLDDYLQSRHLKLSPEIGFLDVVAIKIPSTTKFYGDLSATERVFPKAPSKLVKLDPSKPLAKEMSCMNALSSVPESGNVRLAFDAGSGTRQPVIVYEGLKRGGKTVDAIYTSNGIFFSEYNPNEKYPDEHYYELPGTRSLPVKQYIYTNYSERSYGNPVISDSPEKDLRPAKKIVKTDFPLVDPNSDAMKALDTQLLAATRQIRIQFDTNPRLSSKENLSLIAAAINECKKVKALHPEIEFFEGHIFPANGNGAHRPAQDDAARLN